MLHLLHPPAWTQGLHRPLRYEQLQFYRINTGVQARSIVLLARQGCEHWRTGGAKERGRGEEGLAFVPLRRDRYLVLSLVYVGVLVIDRKRAKAPGTTAAQRLCIFRLVRSSLRSRLRSVPD